MEFCPKCGSRLTLNKTKAGKKIKINLACSKCGYSQKEVKKPVSNRYIKNKENPQKFVTVISKEEQKINTLPTLKVECPKCGNKKVYVWQVQTRGGDESSTQFMRCTKCDHTFREYT
jgi:DNA-directed RNA polymerase subunit M